MSPEKKKKKKKMKKKKKTMNETDSETFDPDALYIDEAQWSYLTAEHKLSSSTASFPVPRS